MLLAGLSLIGGTTAQGADLGFSYLDPVADHTGTIDVTRMVVAFDNATGAYMVILRATTAHPFVGEFRVNINLFNPDVDPANSLFQDAENDFNLATATTKLVLTGTDPNLLAWNDGDRVATNTNVSLGNPPGTTFFRSSVANRPFTFLTNEDAIAFGPAGLATIGPPAPLVILETVDVTIQGIMNSNPGTPLADKIEDVFAKVETALDELAKTPPPLSWASLLSCNNGPGKL